MPSPLMAIYQSIMAMLTATIFVHACSLNLTIFVALNVLLMQLEEVYVGSTLCFSRSFFMYDSCRDILCTSLFYSMNPYIILVEMDHLRVPTWLPAWTKHLCTGAFTSTFEMCWLLAGDLSGFWQYGVPIKNWWKFLQFEMEMYYLRGVVASVIISGQQHQTFLHLSASAQVSLALVVGAVDLTEPFEDWVRFHYPMYYRYYIITTTFLVSSGYILYIMCACSQIDQPAATPGARLLIFISTVWLSFLFSLMVMSCNGLMSGPRTEFGEASNVSMVLAFVGFALTFHSLHWMRFLTPAKKKLLL